MFLEASGFLLIPHLKRPWAPQGQTPVCPGRYQHGKGTAFSALAVSPKRKRLALYVQFHTCNLTGVAVVGFLKQLVSQLRGPLFLLWERGTSHRRQLVQDFRQRPPRLHAEYFPADAPERNPAE